MVFFISDCSEKICHRTISCKVKATHHFCFDFYVSLNIVLFFAFYITSHELYFYLIGYYSPLHTHIHIHIHTLGYKIKYLVHSSNIEHIKNQLTIATNHNFTLKTLTNYCTTLQVCLYRNACYLTQTQLYG